MYGYGNYRNSGISRIFDYAQAVKWFDDTPPIRGKGRNAGVKPLGHRNRVHFQIHKRDGDAIACRLYDTDVVTYYPNGDIVVKPLGYTTMTTANFISDVLGIHAYIHDKSLQIGVQGLPYRIKQQLTLRRNEQGSLTVVEAEKFHTLNINRKVKKEALASIAPFEAYVRQQMKIRDRGTFENTEKLAMLEELGLTFTGNDHHWEVDFHLWREDAATSVLRHKRLVDLARSDDIGNWYLAIRLLAFSQVRWMGELSTTTEHIINALHDSVMAVTPSVFDKVEVPLGMVKKNRYAKFVPFIEEAAKWNTSTPT